MNAFSHPCDRIIPFIDVDRHTNALKDRMSEKGLNMDAPSHPCDRVIPFIDVYGHTNALKGTMSEKGLNIKRLQNAAFLAIQVTIL